MAWEVELETERRGSSHEVTRWPRGRLAAGFTPRARSIWRTMREVGRRRGLYGGARKTITK